MLCYNKNYHLECMNHGHDLDNHVDHDHDLECFNHDHDNHVDHDHREPALHGLLVFLLLPVELQVASSRNET